LKDVDIAEVDAIVENSSGTRYAVEIKAGRLDVSGVRQAFTNAKLLGLKPLVVCKGFIDDAARAIAEQLGVKVVELSDQFLVDSEELEIIVRESVENAIDDYLMALLTPLPALSDKEIAVLKALAENPTLADAAQELSLDLTQLLDEINSLKRKRILPKTRNYRAIRRRARILLYKLAFEKRINEVLSKLEKQIRELEDIYLSGKQ